MRPLRLLGLCVASIALATLALQDGGASSPLRGTSAERGAVILEAFDVLTDGVAARVSESSEYLPAGASIRHAKPSVDGSACSWAIIAKKRRSAQISAFTAIFSFFCCDPIFRGRSLCWVFALRAVG